jgi:hypothetical protein
MNLLVNGLKQATGTVIQQMESELVLETLSRNELDNTFRKRRWPYSVRDEELPSALRLRFPQRHLTQSI